MTLDEIKELVQIVLESGVAELEVERGEDRVRIRRTLGEKHEVVVPNYAAAPVSAHPVPAPAANPHSATATAPTASAETDSSLVLVKSPIVGTYYEASAPGSPPFVRVGDTVQTGQVLCIIESMKLMNEIEAEIAGTIVGKLVENGRPVEYGEALFSIRPL